MFVLPMVYNQFGRASLKKSLHTDTKKEIFLGGCLDSCLEVFFLAYVTYIVSPVQLDDVLALLKFT